MEYLLSLAIESIFINNILLAMFLGMCSFLGCAKNIKTATGLGFAVIFVLTITTPVIWALNHFFLKPGALTWAGFPEVDFLSPVRLAGTRRKDIGRSRHADIGVRIHVTIGRSERAVDGAVTHPEVPRFFSVAFQMP